MESVRLLLDLLAVIGGSSMLSLLSPWKVQARAVPALLFVVGMIVMVLPMLPVAALAMMLPAALLQRFLGIDLHGHEAADYSPAAKMAKNATQAARERVRPSRPLRSRSSSRRRTQARMSPARPNWSESTLPLSPTTT